MLEYKRIAKNAGFLYIRMLFNLFISLYTSRLILQALGIVDFGIYNVVGGIITMVAFFQSALTNVSMRFFSCELGAKHKQKLKKLFRFYITCFCLLGLASLVLSIPIGLYVVNDILVIPSNRIFAANTIFIFSIMSFVASIVTITFNASIVAHECMSVYAYIGMFQAISKLTIAFILLNVGYDRLILYGVMEVLVSLIVLFIYWLYVKSKFEEYSIKPYWSKEYAKTFFPFVSWNLVGCGVWALNQQGINMLLNIFFNPVVNAARGISVQVTGLTKMFSSSIYFAFSPQIIKNFASGDYDTYRNLLYNSSRYSFFMAWIVSLPVMLNTSFLLDLWLVEVPDVAPRMTILTIIFVLIDVLNEPIWTAVQASGYVQTYQLWGNVIFTMAFPLSYVTLRLGHDCYTPFYVLIILRTIYIFIILLLVKNYIEVQYQEYLLKVIRPIVSVVVICLILCLTSSYLISDDGWIRFISISLISLIVSAFAILFVGMGVNERRFVINKIKSKIK